MNSKYFSRRKFFDFNPHPLDVGVPFSNNNTHADVHFLIKIQKLPESELEEFFLRHYNYYKKEFNDTDGKVFFKELWETINYELKKERNKLLEKLSANQKKRNDLRIRKFQYFIENVLPKHDKWSITIPNSEKQDLTIKNIINEIKISNQVGLEITKETIDKAFSRFENNSLNQNENSNLIIKEILNNYIHSNKEIKDEIKSHFNSTKNLDKLLLQFNKTLEEVELLKQQITKLKTELNVCKTVESSKILIKKEDEESLLDIFLQLRDLEVKPKHTLLTTQSQLTWVRLICNNFALTGNSKINFENTKKYFYDQRNIFAMKGKFIISPK